MYGGTVTLIPAPGDPPVDGLSIVRHMRTFGTRFTAVIDGQEVACSEGYADLTKGGRLPSLSGWAEISEVRTQEAWRRQGIGTWVMQHLVDWLRLGGCDRCLFPVSSDDEEEGAGPFYESFGWMPFTRSIKWWERT